VLEIKNNPEAVEALWTLASAPDKMMMRDAISSTINIVLAQTTRLLRFYVIV
jgi:hypothetical protein